ncbi:protein FAM65C-like, partial [Sinocyclocheilus grahami]|uniref:protein FAM65C-like n=1 Tax=Sinocyclocheilus grahami TaxID=75366 RepID=UPI0007AC539C
VLIRLGRQRWRIRGRIQTDDRQLWDEEEMVFLPHIHGNFEIKAEESVEWPSETDTASPSPAGSKRDSIFLFHRYSTPDILKQNGEATPSTETTAPDEAPEEETLFKQGIEDRLLVKDSKAGRAQKRAVAKRVSSLLDDLNTELEEMSNAETLKKLDLQIRQLNEVLKKDLDPPQMPSSQTLAVEEEEVLGSFDFLSADCNEDEISNMGSIRLGYTGLLCRWTKSDVFNIPLNCGLFQNLVSEEMDLKGNK